MKKIGLLLLLLLPITILAQTGTLTTKTIQHDGKTREYLIYVPTVYDGSKQVPLVLNLHGHGSNMNEQLAYGDFRKIADTANFILVVPNGLKDQDNKRYWNFDSTPGGSDDIGFLSALLDKLMLNYEINSNRVYFTGLSNGGFMSNYLACYLSGRVTAIASVSGTLLSFKIGQCNPGKPIPAMHIHGTADAVVPYAGKIGIAAAEDLVAHWVNVNNCNATPTVTTLPNIDASDGCAVKHYVYTGGTNGSTVEFYKVIGGGHTWPGAPIDIALLGNTNHDFDASRQIWRFFSSFSSDKLLAVSKEEGKERIIHIYPVPSKGEITVSSSKEIKAIYVFNFQGKEIRHLSPRQKEVKIEQLPAGVYFLRIKTNHRWVTQKISIEK